ncbi:MAG TPA: tetratricopeptide repeat protein, partial [Planctomycetia bacterium]|nr:tetratricopeptide repeat protein [Planctomycetia bacterium]
AYPAVPDYQIELSLTQNNLGSLLLRLGQRDEARREFEAARALQKKLVDAYPAVPDYQQYLAGTHDNLGSLLIGLGLREKARHEYGAARALQKKLADAYPAVADYKLQLGGSYCNFGNLLRSEGKPADSLPLYDLAIRTLTPVHEKEPRDVRARSFLRNSHLGQALAYGLLNKHAEAVKDWDRAVALSSAAEQPTLGAKRAASLALAGQVAKAVDEISELAKSAKPNAGQWYDFACVYAVASGKVADKKQEYAGRAMELLQQAVKAGWTEAAHMKQDSDLDPLRDRDDFKMLLADLEAKSPPKSGPPTPQKEQ